MFFNYIDFERSDAGITQTALCSEAEIMPQHYSRWKKGEISPTERNLWQLADALERLRAGSSDVD